VASVKLLTDAAEKYLNTLRIQLAGVDQPETKDLLARLRLLDNVTDLGPYQYPEDIPKLYQGVHLNWCLDLSDGLNSRLLLPNRIYEGGAMGVPALAENGTATGDYVLRKELGIVISAPLSDTFDTMLSKFTNVQFQNLKESILANHPSAFFDVDQHSNLFERLEKL
jgi:glycosyltransferase involved in cell wall biosynthesis